MPRARLGELELEYMAWGDRARGRPLLLVRGLGTQMIDWPDEFCETLVEHGHFLVAFDNRDVGLSSWFDEAGVPNISKLRERLARGETPELPYTLDDMADDVVGLMDVLELPSAHLCGMSMGGMIAQVACYRRPERVRSLVSVMSGTGNPELPRPTHAAMKALLTPPPTGREAYIAHQVQSAQAFAGPDYPVPDEVRAARAARAYDRAFHPAGAARQYAAILAHGDRSERLAAVRAPTLVIHGLADPLLPPEAGRDTALRIPGARLLEIPGMGHEIPAALVPRIAEAISRHTEAAEAGGGRGG